MSRSTSVTWWSRQSLLDIFYPYQNLICKLSFQTRYPNQVFGPFALERRSEPIFRVDIPSGMTLIDFFNQDLKTKLWRTDYGEDQQFFDAPQNIQKIKPFSEVSNPSKLSSITCHTTSFVIWSVWLKHTAIKFCFRKMHLVMFAKAEKMKTKSRIWKEKFSILSPSFELFKTWLYSIIYT